MTDFPISCDDPDLYRPVQPHNPIERVAVCMQRLRPEIRWIATNMQGWVQALGMGVEPRRGSWERRGWRLLVLSDRVGAVRPLSFAVNAVLLVLLYASQFRVRRSDMPRASLFVGINALREAELVRRFAEMESRPVIQIDGRSMAGFFAYEHVGFWDLCREIFTVRRDVWNQSADWESLTRLSWLHAVNFLMMRGHQYAYLRVWFRRHLRKPGTSTVVACTAANSPAYAAIAAGAQVVYLLHGFQRRSIVYPDFSRCISITTIEAEHVRCRLPNCAVTVAEVLQDHNETRRVAVVTGILWRPDGFDNARPFIEWARRNEIPVIIRPHPVDSSGYWEQWRGVPGVEIVADGRSFAEFLKSVRPRFLASWYSTVLFDALAKGIVPVTVCPDSDELIDTVYPVRDLSIRWPEQEEIVARLIDDDDARADYLARQFAKAMDGNRDDATSSAPAA